MYKFASQLDIPIDPMASYEIIRRSDFKVVTNNEEIFDALLCMIDPTYGQIGRNQFYHIQLLERVVFPAEKKMTAKKARLEQRVQKMAREDRGPAPFVVLVRYGRIGSQGNGEATEFHHFNEAKTKFRSIFNEKTEVRTHLNKLNPPKMQTQ